MVEIVQINSGEQRVLTEEEMTQELIRNCNISRLEERGKEFYAHIDTKLVKQYNEKEIKKIVTKLRIL